MKAISWYLSEVQFFSIFRSRLKHSGKLIHRHGGYPSGTKHQVDQKILHRRSGRDMTRVIPLPSFQNVISAKRESIRAFGSFRNAFSEREFIHTQKPSTENRRHPLWPNQNQKLFLKMKNSVPCSVLKWFSSKIFFFYFQTWFCRWKGDL